jgi:hypothetical protein
MVCARSHFAQLVGGKRLLGTEEEFAAVPNDRPDLGVLLTWSVSPGHARPMQNFHDERPGPWWPATRLSGLHRAQFRRIPPGLSYIFRTLNI